MHARITAACLVATLAFWAYTRTLLPGVDLGDTGGFQAAVLWPEASARQAYPLYYTLARPFVRATCQIRAAQGQPCDPALGLNLFSAVCGAVAAGLLTVLAAALARSAWAGAAAGLLLAFSYTFWTQAIIAEVYTLHLALITACLLALHAYAAAPATWRLAAFFALYAAAFGNHLSMILLLPPFAALILLVTPHPRRLWRPAPVLLAIAIAALGALQYWPHLAFVAASPDAPATWLERLAAFWFDTTKADWRETMVMGIRGDQVADRLAMWGFDARQQFGAGGLLFALAGAAWLCARQRAWAVAVLGAWAIATVFALTYNVGDTHVFFLPAHLLTALCAGLAVAWLQPLASTGARRALVPAAALAIIALAGWRGWTTWPAVDRHDDRRGEQLIAQLAVGVSDPDALLVSQMNWQLENVLLYTARWRRPDLTWVRLADVLPHFPFLLADQRAIGRAVVLTAEAAQQVAATYGDAVPIVPDLAAPPAPGLLEAARRVPPGSRYVLSLLTPPREEQLDADEVAATLDLLTGGRGPTLTTAHFQVIAGVAGRRPDLYRASDRPFRTAAGPFAIRMESWLPSDTFRRAGFGHVLRGRERLQILERGANLVWITAEGRASRPIYAASLFAPRPRYRVAGAEARFARAD